MSFVATAQLCVNVLFCQRVKSLFRYPFTDAKDISLHYFLQEELFQN